MASAGFPKPRSMPDSRLLPLAQMLHSRIRVIPWEQESPNIQARFLSEAKDILKFFTPPLKPRCDNCKWAEPTLGPLTAPEGFVICTGDVPQPIVARWVISETKDEAMVLQWANQYPMVLHEQRCRHHAFKVLEQPVANISETATTGI